MKNAISSHRKVLIYFNFILNLCDKILQTLGVFFACCMCKNLGKTENGKVWSYLRKSYDCALESWIIIMNHLPWLFAIKLLLK